MNAVPAVGVLGGTFDPVHVGHVEIATHVQRRLGLARMLFVPTAVPPHKTGLAISPIRHREAMLRLAIAGRDDWEISDLESRGDAPTYTIDTLRRLRATPGAGHPVFVIGMDSLLDLPTWHLFGDLMREFDLAVVDRPDLPLERVARRLDPQVAARLLEAPPEEDLPGIPPLGHGGRILHVTMEPVAVSSSDIRRRAASDLDLATLVPPGVARYIRRNRLYRQEDDN